MKFKHLKLFIILNFCFLFLIKPSNNKNPFSEIKITSKRAVCQKDKANKSVFNFTYIDNVEINFADGSFAKADKLSIKINTKKINNNEKNKTENIKKITLNKNVFLKRENRIIKTDKAEIFPTTKICKLSGNIKIEQTKKSEKDLPIITECQNAHLDLVTEKINFFGNKNKPVNSIIKLEGHPGLVKKKKRKG
ncbi:hypothetical protein GF385_03570 [Candidatus Dependentiae bacterium]|nr:hypothetical protein [Candidatus Dependentiae bacterium]